MKLIRFINIVILLFCISFNTQGQNIKGLWRSPKDMAVFHYRFDSLGTMQYNFYGCLSQQQRKGHYTVKQDSIFILFDTLTTEEKMIYRVKSEPIRKDTLYIINENKIKVNNYIFLYSEKVWPPEIKLEVLVTPSHIQAANVIGKYYLQREYYDMKKPFSNTFLLKIKKDGSFSYSKTYVKNNKNKYLGKWEIKNDTLYCKVDEVKYHLKNSPISKEPLEFKFIFMSYNAYEATDDKIIECLYRK